MCSVIGCMWDLLDAMDTLGAAIMFLFSRAPNSAAHLQRCGRKVALSSFVRRPR